MKQLFIDVHTHIIKHKYKYLGLAAFLKFMVIWLLASLVINGTQHNNAHAQTILPLSSDMCYVYDNFVKWSWAKVKMWSQSLINAGIYNIDNFPYLFFFAAVADYNMGDQMSAITNLNYILDMQGLPIISDPKDFMSWVNAVNPLITSWTMMWLQALDGFTYYQGIYSICSDTVDIPTDTSNNTYIKDAFILKSYQANIGALSTVPDGTYVGKTRINTNNSSWEIIQKFALQSSWYTDEIEIVGPENLQVFSDGSGTLPLKGIINNPTLLDTSVANTLSNVTTVMEWTNDQDVPMFFKDKTSWEPINVTMNIPITSGTVWDSILVYYSNDSGSTWNFSEQTTISEINSKPYAVISSTHATIFAIVSWWTWLFTINNDESTTISTGVVLTINVPEGTYMRFSNDNTIRSDWEIYNEEKNWTLSDGQGTKTVYAQFDLNNNTGTVEVSTSDTIVYETEAVVVTAPSNGGGGGGGSSITPDVCYDGDYSESYYDRTCGCRPSSADETTWEINNTQHESPDVQWDISWSKYSNEINMAYQRAYSFGITTMNTIRKADIEWTLVRKNMAKLITNFAVNVLEKDISTGKVCSFSDISHLTKETQYYILAACRLGLMWYESDGITLKTNFDPNDEITRAEFGTIISRLIRWGKYNNWFPFYNYHLNALANKNIMKKIDNPLQKEKRGRVMLMMQRIFQTEQ